jgi:hypothetical protein
MGSGAVIYVPSFIKIGSGVQNSIRGDTHTHGQQRDLISLLYFFQNKESRLINLDLTLIIHFTIEFDLRSVHNHDNVKSRNIPCSHHRIRVLCIYYKEHMSNNR